MCILSHYYERRLFFGVWGPQEWEAPLSVSVPPRPTRPLSKTPPVCVSCRRDLAETSGAPAIGDYLSPCGLRKERSPCLFNACGLGVRIERRETWASLLTPSLTSTATKRRYLTHHTSSFSRRWSASATEGLLHLRDSLLHWIWDAKYLGSPATLLSLRAAHTRSPNQRERERERETRPMRVYYLALVWDLMEFQKNKKIKITPLHYSHLTCLFLSHNSFVLVKS